MSEPPALPDAVLDHEVRRICARYRIDPDAVRELLEANFARRPDLVRTIADTHPAADVTRLSAYRRVVKETKKQVYYRLRRYQRDRGAQARARGRLEALVAGDAPRPDVEAVLQELLHTHVSTQERAPSYEAFYRRLFELIEPPRTILDLGCGLHPLSYPFHAPGMRPDLYYALDRAEPSTAVVAALAPHVRPAHLVAVCGDLADVPWTDPAGTARPVFDLAFLLKLVPVVHRVQPDALGTLADLPARRLLVTASAEALTRRENIRRREDRILRSFIETTGRPVEAGFDVGTEFGYLLGPPRDGTP